MNNKNLIKALEIIASQPRKPPSKAQLENRLRKLFDEYNKKHFKNKLDKIPIKLMRDIENGDDAIGGRFTAKIDSKGNSKPFIEIVYYPDFYLKEPWNESTWMDMSNSLLHEMVHYAVWFYEGPVDHGPEFQKWHKKVFKHKYS